MKECFGVRLATADVFGAGNVLELFGDAGLIKNELDLMPQRAGGNCQPTAPARSTDEILDAGQYDEMRTDVIEIQGGFSRHQFVDHRLRRRPSSGGQDCCETSLVVVPQIVRIVFLLGHEDAELTEEPLKHRAVDRFVVRDDSVEIENDCAQHRLRVQKFESMKVGKLNN